MSADIPNDPHTTSAQPDRTAGRIKRIVIRTLAVVIVWLLLRTLAFQGMYIPSDSMSGTLQKGDYVLVNKLALGARLPGDENVRFPGYGSIELNDILVFNLPTETTKSVGDRKPYIKRCIGLPGDTVSITAGIVSVNRKPIGEPEFRTYRFRIQLKSGVFAKQFFSNQRITDYKADTANTYIICTTQQHADLLAALTEVAAVVQSPGSKLNYETALFPKDASRKWNSDNYGPLLVPAKGQTIVLDARHLHEFRTIITEYEGNTLMLKRDSVYINSIYSPTYTFENNYYFVAGDNRYSSVDSRYFGFIPENHIIGKADVLLYGEGKGRFLISL
jgi:signal peptidase I